MKRHCLFLLSVTLTLVLLGCKPKTTTISGQVFIVTSDATNIKFGLVEILLIEKQQINQFLHQRQSTIESEKALREQTVQLANEAKEKAEKDLSLFLNGGPLTQPDYLKLKAEYQGVEKDVIEALRKMTAIGKKVNERGAEMEAVDRSAKAKGFADANDYAKSLDFKSQLAIVDMITKHLTSNLAAIKEVHEIYQQSKPKEEKMDSLKKELAIIEGPASLEEATLTEALQDATSALTIAEARIESYPSVDDYLAKFSPVISGKAVTDADGKYTLTYKRGIQYVLYAKCEREIGTDKERYCWLVNAPTRPKTEPLFLGNANVALFDPDNFFPLKPKAYNSPNIAKLGVLTRSRSE